MASTSPKKGRREQWFTFQKVWLANLRRDLLGTEETFGTPCKYQEGEHHRALPDLEADSSGESLRRTLILDLDETLVHTKFEEKLGWVTHRRPGVASFLAALHKDFEIVTFTSGLREYAEPIIDMLDPKGLISHRLYREHTRVIQGIHVKDLSKMNRSLARTIIVDNSPESYLLQPENAVPIKPFFGSPSDLTLLELIPFLASLASEDVADVRKVRARGSGGGSGQGRERRKRVKGRRDGRGGREGGRGQGREGGAERRGEQVLKKCHLSGRFAAKKRGEGRGARGWEGERGERRVRSAGREGGGGEREAEGGWEGGVQRRWSDLDRRAVEGGKEGWGEEDGHSTIPIDVPPDPLPPLWGGRGPPSAACDAQERSHAEGGATSRGGGGEAGREEGGEGREGALGGWRALGGACVEVLRGMSPPPSLSAVAHLPLPDQTPAPAHPASPLRALDALVALPM